MVIKPTPVQRAVHYRESDGKPMSESDLHQDETIDLKLMLRAHFTERGDVYVASNNFLYYEQGQPKSVISPDVYVVFGIAPHRRRVFKLWEERHAPSAVFEVSSRKTWRQDLGAKMATCARLGVAEYWLYDPEHDYLDPPLQGFALTSGGYVPIAPDDAGHIRSTALGLQLDLDGQGFVRLIDARSGQRLRRPREEQQAAVRAERRATREAVARKAAEQVAAREAAAREVAEQVAAREAAAREAAEHTAAREAAAREEVEAEMRALREENERLRRGTTPHDA